MPATAKPVSTPTPVDTPEYFDGETAEETVVEQPPVKVVEKPKHNPHVLAEAYEFGMSKEEIDGYEPDTLTAIVRNVNKQLRQSYKAQSMSDARDADRERVQQPQAQPVVQEPEDDFGIDKDLLDPKLEALLRRQQEEIKALKAKTGSFEEREKIREARTLEDVIDGAFEALGPDYEPLFMPGAARELPTDDLGMKAKKRRHAVLGVAFQSGLKLQTASPRQVAKAIREAAETIYEKQAKPAAKPTGGAYSEVIGDAGEREVADRRIIARDPETGRILPKIQVDQLQADLDFATTTARPTHRKAQDMPNGPEKAKRNLAARLREERPGEASDTGHATVEDFI